MFSKVNIANFCLTNMFLKLSAEFDLTSEIRDLSRGKLPIIMNMITPSRIRKRLLGMLLFLGMLLECNGQVPQSFNYQAILRNAQGDIIPNRTVDLRFSIQDSIPNGQDIYVELAIGKISDQFGLINSSVGNNTPIVGNFSSINWGNHDKYLKVELDLRDGNGFNTMGTSQLLSVPYALYAGNGSGGALAMLTDVDVAGVSNGDVLQWNGTQWVAAAIQGGAFAIDTNHFTGTGTPNDTLRLKPGQLYYKLNTNSAGGVSWTGRGGYSVNSGTTIANAPTTWTLRSIASTQYGAICSGSCHLMISVFSPVSRTVYFRPPNYPSSSRWIYDIPANRTVTVFVEAIAGEFEWYSNTTGSISLDFIGFLN